ncbi:hypothetical protein ACFQU3_18000 [Terrabacter sp. GCM10028922]|uniref:hypothetical protein n=1 Tax=Terrabacter sp. GCM10028922 TaxID=3273428 RepID=UPI00361CB4EA
MSNESTHPGPAEQPRSTLPQFDPDATGTPTVPDETQTLPTAPTTEVPVTAPATPYAYAAAPAPAPEQKAAGDGIRWSAKKTAVTAGLTIVLASAGAIGAAAAVPAGSTGGDTGIRGNGRTFQFPGGQQNQQGQNGGQLPNLQNGMPGGGLNGIDPNQLSQLDPQDLLQQLNQGIDPFSGGGTSPRSGGDDGSGRGDTGSSTGTTKTT